MSGWSAKRLSALPASFSQGSLSACLNEWDVDTKVNYFVTPNSRFTYGHQSVALNDAWRTHSTIYGVLWEGTTRGTDLKRSFDQRRGLDYLPYDAREPEVGIVATGLPISGSGTSVSVER